MSTSTSSDTSQLAKFRADYFAIPISEFTCAINMAMLAADPTTRDNHVKAVLDQYGYESLTELDIESIIHPRDILNSSPTSTTQPPGANAPPATNPVVTGTGSWIFDCYAGSYGVTSNQGGGFPSSTTTVIIGYNGSLDLGSSLSTKLSSTVVVDNQSDYWAQWDVTAGREWYIAQFSTNFNMTLESTTTTLSGFHCVVDTNGQQTNTPVSAECSQLKANTGDTESDVGRFFKNPRLDATIALTGLTLLRYWYKRRNGAAEGKTPLPLAVQEEANRYEERVKIIRNYVISAL